MIQSIQSQIGQTIEIMERGSRQIGEGVALANQSRQSLKQISEAVTVIDDS